MNDNCKETVLCYNLSDIIIVDENFWPHSWVDWKFSFELITFPVFVNDWMIIMITCLLYFPYQPVKQWTDIRVYSNGWINLLMPVLFPLSTCSQPNQINQSQSSVSQKLRGYKAIPILRECYTLLIINSDLALFNLWGDVFRSFPYESRISTP